MMHTQIYKNADLYIGRWLLVCTVTDDLSVLNTRYNIYFCRGTCFVEIIPPGGGSISCMNADGPGLTLATLSEGIHRWSGGARMHIAGLMGVSWHFALWMPGILLEPSDIPFTDSRLYCSREQYDTTVAPADGQRFVGLVEDGLLTALKYHIGNHAYVEATVEYQRLTQLDGTG